MPGAKSSRPAIRSLALLALASAEERPGWLARIFGRRKDKSQAEIDAERRKRRNVTHEEHDKPQPFMQCPKCSASLRANHLEEHMKRVH